jgi:hypothetical protein
MASRRLAGPLFLVPLLALACETEVQPSAGDELAGIDDAPAELGVTTPQRVMLTPVEGAAANVVALLTPRDTVTEVVVMIQGSAPGSPHAARIYAGHCGTQGAVMSPLSNIITDAAGAASSQQIVAQSPILLMGGATSIVVYAPGGTPGRPLACGNIPHPAEAAGNQPGTMPPGVLPPAGNRGMP